MKHPEEFKILDYVTGVCTEDITIEIDSHIAECDICLDRIRALLYLKNNFEVMWEEWPAVKSISPWVQRIRRSAAIVADLLLDSSVKIASLSPRHLLDGYKSEMRPVFAGVGSSRPNMPEEINRRAAQSKTMDIYKGERLEMRIAADSRRKQVMVVYWLEAEKDVPLFAMLVPENIDLDAMVSEFRPVEGAAYCLAEFRGLPDGSFEVLVVPAGQGI